MFHSPKYDNNVENRPKFYDDNPANPYNDNSVGNI